MNQRMLKQSLSRHAQLFGSTSLQRVLGLGMSVGLLQLGLLLNPVHAEDHGSADASGPITALTKLSSLRTAATETAPRFPAIQEWHTASGMRVLFVNAPEIPVVNIRLTFAAGSSRDTAVRPGLFGLASLTAQLLDEGTRSQTTDQIAARFEALGTNYSANAYRDMFAVELQSLADQGHLQASVDQMLALLQDAQFPAESMDRIFQNASIGQKQREESPESIASIRFFRELYGAHPYGEPTTGTQASLKKITREDLLAFRDRFLVAENASLAITGQLTAEQAHALAASIDQGLRHGQKADPLPDPVPLTAPRTVTVPFQSSQTHVLMGELGITRANPDLITLSVGNEVLGGGDFNALLMKELREKRGLTYGAYSGFSPMLQSGPFILSYSTRGDQAAQSLSVAQDTLKRFLQTGPDPEALKEAKDGLLKGFPLSLASNASINGYLAMMGFYGLPVSYLQNYWQSVASVTPEQVKTAFQTYVHPDRMLTVIVGQIPPGMASASSPTPESLEKSADSAKQRSP